MIFRGLTKKDKEFIKETTKTDLQRQQDKTNEAYRKVAKLEMENAKLKDEIFTLTRTLNDTYKWFEANNQTIPILIDEVTAKEYTDEDIEVGFAEYVYIPVADVVSDKMQKVINEFYCKYKNELEKR